MLSAEAAEKCKGGRKSVEVVKAAIKKHVSDMKVRYKWLDGGVEFVDVIPKNPSGKLLRRFLREKAKEMRKQQAQTHRSGSKL